MGLLILDSKDFEKSEDFTIECVPPIAVTSDSLIALKSMSIWVSWNNIDKKYENNTFKYFDGSLWHEVTLDNGNYTLRELNNFLIKLLGDDDTPIKFKANFATQRFVIELNDNYMMDLRKGKLHEILGFEPELYDQKHQEGKFMANISRGIDDIHIHCDIITGALYNSRSSDILYSFTPSNPPGSLIKVDENHPLFLPVNRRDYIHRIRMYVTNQDNDLIDLNNMRVLYRLLIT